MSEPSAESLVRAREWFSNEDHVVIFGGVDAIDATTASLATLLDTIDAKAREEERERCAKIADRVADVPLKTRKMLGELAGGQIIAADTIAKAIRSGALRALCASNMENERCQEG
jgi:hypothetical protein